MILGAQLDMEVVGTTATGTETVAMAAELEPDVVVVDIAMPGLNGLDAARRILGRLGRTQVVILSMHATAEHLHQALATGVLGYVVKSSAGTDVIRAVRSAASGRRFLSEPLEALAAEQLSQFNGWETSPGPLASLSAREREIVQLVAEGHSSAKIAEALGLAPGTVDTYRSRIMRKLGVDDLVGLVRFAIQHGLTPS
jgi:DNA-binding NarL/FixJ family response regulator